MTFRHFVNSADETKIIFLSRQLKWKHYPYFTDKTNPYGRVQNVILQQHQQNEQEFELNGLLPGGNPYN